MKSQEKLASALERVKSLADKHGGSIVASKEMQREDRQLLVKTSWLQEITRGWYMLTRPDLVKGDSAAWHANFWDFLKIYLSEQYGNDYCLSAQISLELTIGETLIPQQVVVMVKKGGTVLNLPFGTSVLTYSDEKNMPIKPTMINGLKAMPLPLALCKVQPAYFQDKPNNIGIALSSIRDPSDITRTILEHDFQRAASRIIGAYRSLDLSHIADEMSEALSNGGMVISVVNPFTKQSPYLGAKSFRSPYAARIEALWEKHREPIIKVFPKAPGLPKNKNKYLTQVENLYQFDAYNSLSIEGYRVSSELIEKVQNKGWNPDLDPNDAKTRDALAARGYFEAFQSVKNTISDILQGESPGKCVKEKLAKWYQNLFAPSVQAGLIPHSGLVGYRNNQVYIRNSRHVPLPKDALLDAMEVFFDCLETESESCVRAVLGHYIFVYIHPYMDGNGRLARFLMNTQLSSGGYPWTVIQVKHRKKYIDTLEYSHVEGDLTKLAKFIASEMSIGS